MIPTYLEVNKKSLIKICAVLPVAMLCLSTNPVYADQNDQSSSQTQSSETNKENVSYQTLYIRCINQANGQVLQTFYADTVKVVDGQAQRKNFNIGQIPNKIGQYQLAEKPGNSITVDPTNPSGVTYLTCDYYLPQSKQSSSSAKQTPANKQPNVVRDARNAYQAYHHTAKGFVAPGYYDSQNQHHPKMSMDEWRRRNNMPGSVTPGLTSKKQIAKAKQKANKNSNKVANKKKKAAIAKSQVKMEAKDRNSNIFKFIVVPLILIVIIIVMIPRKFWHRKFGKHTE